MLTFRKTGETQVTEFLRTRSNGALIVLNEWLNTRKFSIANRPTIADFSMSGYLFWPDEIGVNWNKDYPNIARWLNDIAALPGWVHPYELMPDQG